MFLRQSDFTNLIQQDHLTQGMQGNPLLLTQSMREAQSEIENYLRAAFDLSLIFVTYSDYDAAKTYEPGVYVWRTVTQEVDGVEIEVDKLFKSKITASAGQTPEGTPEVWEIND